MFFVVVFFFFFKQKTAYEMRISDWSSDVCSSDLHVADLFFAVAELVEHLLHSRVAGILVHGNSYRIWLSFSVVISIPSIDGMCLLIDFATATIASWTVFELRMRSEEHTSELQSLMRISYAVFCLKKNTTNYTHS